jgi:hypothetical protein
MKAFVFLLLLWQSSAFGGSPPQKLVFAARGVGPFQLAYDNRAAKTAGSRSIP